MKIEQRKVQGPEREPHVKQTAHPDNPICIGQALGEEKKQITRGAKIEPGDSSLLLGLSSGLEDVFSFACQIKLSCNTGLSITSNFCCSETELRKLQLPLQLQF